ncbi:MAG: orotidine-5'-phosphate decarboxylase [Pseudomonadota bacterium]
MPSTDLNQASVGSAQRSPVDPSIIVAIDRPDADSALSLVQSLDSSLCRVKVGKELFTAAGPKLVEQIQDLGFDVFLDLKFHDIPATVAGAVRSAASLGVWMVNVHASGGRRMLEASADSLQAFSSPPKLIAVTVLTSMSVDELKEIAPIDDLEKHVFHLASIAQESGLDGVVCSAREAAHLRSGCGDHFLLVTPGIRPKGAASDDQTRIVTPPQARQLGADYLVIGRPITQSEDPRAALESISKSLID